MLSICYFMPYCNIAEYTTVIDLIELVKIVANLIELVTDLPHESIVNRTTR